MYLLILIACKIWFPTIKHGETGERIKEKWGEEREKDIIFTFL